jgi:hypothetical protein
MTDTTVTAGTEDTTQTTQSPAEGATTTAAATTTDTTTAATTDTKTTTTTEKPVTPTWRDDWRQALAKGDQKELERLQRLASPEAVYDAYRSLEKKMSGLKVPPSLPDNPTPEQVAEYRKQVGVPEKPEGYLEKLPEGLVIGEEDKPAMTMLAEALHAKNVSPDVLATVVDTYYKIIEHNQEEMVAAQQQLKQQASDALRAEWGADYRPTINSIKAMLDGVDEDTKSLIEGMQLADGSLAFNHPGFMRWMGGLATQINPAALVMPGQSGGDKMATIKQQIEANMAEMSKNINAWQSKANEARRAEHMKLLDAAMKLGIQV